MLILEVLEPQLLAFGVMSQMTMVIHSCPFNTNNATVTCYVDALGITDFTANGIIVAIPLIVMTYQLQYCPC